MYVGYGPQHMRLVESRFMVAIKWVLAENEGTLLKLGILPHRT